ncbi:DUF1223 domain-containing protein [Sedimentitalea sp. HM32M-2]|uniref:DUF1223 domain-containing protein n=1 Tax=Sedimentitalea sp. HM32M-2 TaxID=3351566 RepID=UPI003639DE7C
MPRIVTALIALFLLLAPPVSAQSNPVVVELFTSQGCSACPPADALMHGLARRDDVIALALHVDYWDYIGWKDEFARPGNTARQRGYARAAGRDMIYTPQMIVNGQQDVVGAHARELADIITLYRAQTPKAQISADRTGSALRIHAEPLQDLQGRLTVHLIRYTPLRSAQITRGENAGRDLDYANVVDDWTELGLWDGTDPLDLSIELQGDRPAVVLIQQPGPGAIVAATQVR